MAYGLYLMWTDQQFEALAAAQRVAKASHDMLLGVVDTSPIGIVVVDPAGDITFANAYADSVLGHCDTEFASKECVVKVVPAGASPEPHARTFDVSLVGRPATSELWECVAPDGTRTQIQLSARPYHGSSGAPTGSVVVFGSIR